MTRRFRMDLAYDGTDFEGWQSQKEEGRTVQGEIEKALGVLVKNPVPIVGAGRTDSGVHARSQTAHFEVTHGRMDGGNFKRGLNSLLPPDIRILDCRLVEESFHARFSALARVYQYYILPATVALPWEDRYCLRVNEVPDLNTLNAMASHLKGEIDFTTYSNAQDPSLSKNRFIYHACFFTQGDKLVFRISGNAFLWRMVRSLVGSLLELARKGQGAEAFRQNLDARDRKMAGPTAPAKGLFLHKVIYDEREFSF